MSEEALCHQQPAVQWYLHEVPIEILYAIRKEETNKLAGFHIRFPATGELRDIFFGSDGTIDGFGYEETAQ